MVDQGSSAAWAARHPAAVATEDMRGGAAPIEKEDGLLPGIERGGHGLIEAAAEERSVAGPQLLPHVDQVHRRQVDGDGVAFQRLVGGGQVVAELLSLDRPAPAEDPPTVRKR